MKSIVTAMSVALALSACAQTETVLTEQTPILAKDGSIVAVEPTVVLQAPPSRTLNCPYVIVPSNCRDEGGNADEFRGTAPAGTPETPLPQARGTSDQIIEDGKSSAL